MGQFREKRVCKHPLFGIKEQSGCRAEFREQR
jgi:hypothetical protein